MNKNDKVLNVGESDTLKMYANKNMITNKNIKWTTSDKKIATFSKEGRIKAIKEGTVIITGTTKIGKKTCKVVVKKTECKHKWDTRITFPEGVEKRDAILCACGKVFFEQDTWEVHYFLEARYYEKYGKYINGEELHGEAPIKYEVSCTKPGYKITYCEKCGKELKREELPLNYLITSGKVLKAESWEEMLADFGLTDDTFMDFLGW